MKTLYLGSVLCVWLLPLSVGTALTSGPARVTADQATATVGAWDQSSPTTRDAFVTLNATAEGEPPQNSPGTSPEATQITPVQPETMTDATGSEFDDSPETTSGAASSTSLTAQTHRPAFSSTEPQTQTSVDPTQSLTPVSTAQFITETTGAPATSPTPPLASAETTSGSPDDHKTTTRQVTAGSTMPPLSKPSKTTTHRATTRPGKPAEPDNSISTTIVAGLIGGSLILMMVGLLVIYIKKRKMQKQQIMTTDWAGPSPFLQGGAGGPDTFKKSANRISLTGFLPQRLSQRLSQLREADQELLDMPAIVTFNCREKDEHQSNGPAAAGPAAPTESRGEAPPASPDTAAQSNNALTKGPAESEEAPPEPADH